MESPKQKRIDIPSGVIPAGGKTFYIQYSLSTTRFVEYLKRIPKLSFNTTFRGMYGTLSEIWTLASSGNDMIGAIGGIREKAMNQLIAVKRFDENEIIDVIDLCALFCNMPGEDVSKFEEALHHEKCLILQNEGYDKDDFFLLLTKLIDGLHEASQKIRSLKSQSESNDISLQNIQPIESIS
jgi:hypothetical protein